MCFDYCFLGMKYNTILCSLYQNLSLYCVCAFLLVCESEVSCMSPCTYQGQKSALGVSSHFLPCLRQLALFTAVCAWLTCLWLLGILLTPPPVSLLDYRCVLLFNIGSKGSNLTPHSCLASAFPTEPPLPPALY